MKFNLSTLAIFAGTLKAVVSSSAAEDVSTAHRELAECSAYDTTHEVTSGITLLWTNAADGDTEWLNKANYNYGYLPGIHRFNKVIMAVGDVGTVSCDSATYMNEDVYLEMRSGATLDVSANLNIGDELIVKGGATLSQTGASVLTVGKRVYLAADYIIAESAALSVQLDFYMASNAKLTIEGDATRILASELTPTNSQVHGVMKYVLGPSGTGVFDLADGELTIGSTTALLDIDASGYEGGASSIPLIKASSIVNSFQPARVTISGLAEGLSGAVVNKSDGVYLEVTGGGGPPTPATSSPTPNVSNRYLNFVCRHSTKNL